MSAFYSGSLLLSPFVPITGLTVDKLNFIVCQLIAIGFGRPFQKYFPAVHGSSNATRYVVSLLVGIALCLFCFGHQIFHLLLQGLSCLLIMRYADERYARYMACIFAIVYLSVCHLMRQYYDYGGYTLDITGPLMISTQRLSTLAFNVYDGHVIKSDDDKQGRLTPRQRQHQVRDMPSLLEFFTYLLHFQGILVGPFVFYVDFKNYMDDTIPKPEGMSKEEYEGFLRGTGRSLTVVKWSLFFGLVAFMLQARYPLEFIAEDGFLSYSLISRWLYLTIACFVIRSRYYFAWSLGELSYLVSGCGFTGLNKDTGAPEYKTVQNFEFRSVELCTSMKVAIDNWNIGTVNWLRECVYERVPAKHATLAVFVASATWHGFYPGYYIMFVSVAFFTTVARLARRHLRPHFQSSETLKRSYDVVTGVASMSTLNYSAGAFALLELLKGIKFWWSVYFMVHVVTLAMYFGFLFLKPRRTQSSRPPQAQQESQQADPSSPRE